MSELILKHNLDLRGDSPDHLLLNEIHPLTPGVNRAVVTRYGAFYTKDLVVRDNQDGRVLTINDDYVPVMYYEEPSMLSGLEVCSGIVITDGTVSDTVSIDYRVVGGPYANISAVIIDLIENLNLDERSVAYGDLLGVPNAFPPTQHLHPIGDIYGFEMMVAAVDRVREALLVGDQSSHDEINLHIETRYDALTAAIDEFRDAYEVQKARRDNPHVVTKAQVGLGSVENHPKSSQAEAELGESDSRYMTPLRTAQAIDKLIGVLTNQHINNVANPHSVTKAQVGLSSVDNYSRAEYDARYLRASGENAYTGHTLLHKPASGADAIYKVEGSSLYRFMLGVATIFDVTLSHVSFNKDVIPQSTEERNLGTSALKWLNVYSKYFFGNGAGITNLNGSNVATGTIHPDRIDAATDSRNGLLPKDLFTRLNALPSWTSLQSTIASGYHAKTANGGLNINNKLTIDGSTGDLWALGGIEGASDRRLKTDLKELNNVLEGLDQLTPYTFSWIDMDVPRDMGWMAQDVAKIFPELVSYNKDKDRWGVKYGNASAMLGRGIVELHDKVRNQEKIIEDQHKRLTDLESLVNELMANK